MAVLFHEARNPMLRALIASLRSAVEQRGDDGERVGRVAAALRPYLGCRQLLTSQQREGDPNRYRQHVLHTAPDGSFSLAALVWLPGQETPVHDHVTWCVVGVLEGCESEVQYELCEDAAAPYLLEVGACWNRAGSVAALTPPGDIHRVANAGPERAISLHVYGADLQARGTSIRRRYDLPIRTLPERIHAVG